VPSLPVLWNALHASARCACACGFASQARAFLEAIGEQGRSYYANPELVIDTFYPPLYALSRGLALC